jgi:alcohol dehydrogenase class IV
LAPTLSTAPFRWPDGERLVVFGRGCLADAPELLGAAGYQLLTTPRAATAAPEVVAGAARVHEAPPGRVDEIAAALRPDVQGELLVALGGGRVIDVAKALAAADPPRRVAAIPTTLSGAEMTAVHRHAAGVPGDTAHVRPAIVISDPELSASQPLAELAASAGNALGHAAEGPLTPSANPVATLAALEAASLIAIALQPDPERPDRDALALGALLAGYVIGSTGYGLHHILSQTLVRFAGVGHGPANTIMLPHTLEALARRAPAAIGRLGTALGTDPSQFAAKLARLAGVERLRDVGVSPEQLETCATEAANRPELALTPPPAQREELRELYQAAW